MQNNKEPQLLRSIKHRKTGSSSENTSENTSKGINIKKFNFCALYFPGIDFESVNDPLTIYHWRLIIK